MYKQLVLLDRSLSEKIFNVFNLNKATHKVLDLLTIGYGVIPIILIEELFTEKRLELFILSVVGVVLMFLIIENGIKKFIKRKRPYYSKLTSHSFPSTHATSVGYFFVLSLFYITNPLIILLILIYSMGLGFSRVVLGYHYLSDVVVGFLLGILISLGVLLIGNIAI